MTFDTVFPISPPEFLWVHTLTYRPTLAADVHVDAEGRWNYDDTPPVEFIGFLTAAVAGGIVWAWKHTWVQQLVFGLGVGLMTWVIRSWGGFPEGMAFAVLLMNALTPVIDRYARPRILGRRRDGRPLEPAAVDPRGVDRALVVLERLQPER